jgi:hypothetical protein
MITDEMTSRANVEPETLEVGNSDVPSILVPLVLGPAVPNLTVPVDTALVVPVQDVVLALDNPRQREVLELERHAVLHPVIDVGREGDPAVDVEH